MQRVYGSRELEGMAKEKGWKFVRQVGSHRQFRHDGVPLILTIPAGRKDIPIGTCRQIIKVINGEARLPGRK
jgi:predicted RNA binding protein YcfA (HicA-like mRNA interferase family)